MKRLRILCFSVLFSFLAGLSTPGWSDDTDLYLNQAIELSKETYPNVLFMLDNSGSMNDRMRTDDGTDMGVTRMDVLKKALISVINDAGNINLGLARFTYSTDGVVINGKPTGEAVNKTNAPIMYPIAYIDAPVEEVESGDSNAAVVIPSSASMGSGSDDAEEIIETKAVSTTDTNLDIVMQEIPPGIKIETRIPTGYTNNGDQAMEYTTSKSDVIATSKTVMFFGKEITNLKTGQDNGEVLTAVRFANLGIPQGATIHRAEVDFTSDAGPLDVKYRDWDEGIAYDNDKHPLDITIEGSSGNIFSKDVTGWLSDTAKYPRMTDDNGTILTTSWPIRGKVIDGQVYTTPDVAPILGALVKQATWASGGSFILFFKRTGSASEQARRGFVTSSNSTYNNASPLLRVYWSLAGDMSIIAKENNDVGKYLKSTPPSGGLTNMRLGYDPKATSPAVPADTVIGMRFKLPIPAGAVISEAKIVFTRQGRTNTAGLTVEDSDSKVFNATNPQPSAQALNLKVYAEKIANAEKFPSSANVAEWDTKHLNNPRTKGIDWSLPATTKPVNRGNNPANTAIEDLDQFETPDLSEILTEVISVADWQANNYISFLFEKPSGNTSQNYRRFVEPGETTSTTTTAVVATDETLPRLEIKFSAGDEGSKTVKQLIGLRFENVEIPQGAKVMKASINFTSGVPTSGPASITVQAEDTDDAQPFSNKEGDISSRKLTTAKATWNAEAWSNQAVTYPSADITSVIQAVVNRSGWCGGTQAIALVLSGNGLRNASSFDHSPDKAPVLNFEYDFKQIKGSGCINQSYRTQVSTENDDAEEVSNEGGKMYMTTTLDLGRKDAESRVTAVRFRDIPFDRDVKILKAELIFTAATNTITKDMSGSITIKGQKTSASDFITADYNLSSTGNRPKTSSSVKWTLASDCSGVSGECTPAWKSGVKYGVNVTPIVQEILTQSGWEKYSNMAFFLSDGTGRREAHSAGTNKSGAAQLRIQVQGSLGSEIIATVRSRLKQIAKGLVPSDYTPIVDALYESGLYYRGGPITFGKDRYEVRNHFVSHPATYTGGKVEGPLLPYQCPWDKASQPPVTKLNCQHEKITGEATYKSPMNSPCQNNYLVFLTDGIATKNTAKDLVKSLVGINSCQKVVYEIDGKKQTVGNGECGFELVEFLRTTDNAPQLEGIQNIITHAIGFQLGKAWKKVENKDGACIKQDTEGKCLQYESKYVEDPDETRINRAAELYLADLAVKGGGQFFPVNAGDPEESVRLLKQAFESILAQAVTSSTAFAAPSIAVSTISRLYHKNEVYFALFKPDQYARWDGNIKKFRICEAGNNCKAGDILDATGASAVMNSYISATARSVWTDSPEPDGAEITRGGAGSKVPPAGSRKIYTYIGGETDPGQNHEIDLTSQSIAVGNKALTAELLGINTEGLSATQKEQQRKDLIQWIRGEQTTGEERWRFADPLHSSPVAIVYAASGDKKETTRLFVGTNDGLVRMINADDESGQEVWAFLPQELLPIQASLKQNEPGRRIYGMDATPTFLIKDIDNNGIIDKEKGETVKMFIGMRRGGYNIYALDVTDYERPQLMWVIKGSKNVYGSAQVSSPGFEKLGQTWSKPKVTRVARSTTPVLLFGGGYNLTQDESFSKVDSGNAIYMADAETGELVWWASNSKGKSTSSAPFLELKGMDYAIPSDLALVDAKGSGIVDRIYVGDVNGQIWRIDLSAGTNGVGGRLAALSGDPPTGVSNDNKRRFFYAPDVVTKIKSGDLVYDLVVIVSGTRPDPLGTSTHDQFYALRDFAVSGLIDRDEDGNADTKNTKFSTITGKELVDITDNIVPKSEGESSILAEELQGSKGWYVNLNQQPEKNNWVGEKGLASPVVLKGKVFFTTYIPPLGKSKDPCKPSEGKSYLYSLDVLTGQTTLKDDQLALELKAGITSDIVLFFGKEGIRIITNDFSTPTHESLGDNPGQSGSSGGSNRVCGSAGCYSNPADPIFWMQE